MVSSPLKYVASFNTKEDIAMKYVIMLLDGLNKSERSESENQQWTTDIYAWYEKWDSKIAGGGAALQGPETAKTIRSTGVTDGPFIETKEAIGGFSILEADTIDEAVEIARTWPGVDRGWISVEVRPVDPTM
jgi:hypothetical protein